MNEQKFRAAEKRVWDSFGLTPTERRLDLATIGCSIRIQEIGEGPTVVFIHGGATAGTSWVNLIAELPDFRCVLLDRPGSGLSDSVPLPGGRDDIASYKRQADALIADVADALELERVLVASTSLGGFFGLRGAAAHPDRVERLIEFSYPVGAPMDSVPLPFRVSGIPGLGKVMARMPATAGAVKMTLKQAGLKNAIESGNFTGEMVDWMVSFMNDTPSMLNEVTTTPRLFRPVGGLAEEILHTPELLAKVTMPVYFLWGQDDPNGGEGVARRLVSQLPDATLEMMPGGHAPWIDDPAHAGEVTRRFLLGAG